MRIRFVIGLGNPGEQYRNSPHNLGRELIEEIQKKMKSPWIKGKWFSRTKGNPSFVQLHTNMNLSGEAVQKLVSQFQVSPEEILVCCDDLDLPLGKIRIRKKGSAGTHNGLKSIVAALGSEDFPRLRMGIGPTPQGISATDFVLQPLEKEHRELAQKMTQTAVEAVQFILSDGLSAAMNRFNGKDRPCQTSQK